MGSLRLNGGLPTDLLDEIRMKCRCHGDRLWEESGPRRARLTVQTLSLQKRRNAKTLDASRTPRVHNLGFLFVDCHSWQQIVEADLDRSTRIKVLCLMLCDRRDRRNCHQ